ncbi:hypothetical protein RBB50_012218 [Rhinocladiella similis]
MEPGVKLGVAESIGRRSLSTLVQLIRDEVCGELWCTSESWKGYPLCNMGAERVTAGETWIAASDTGRFHAITVRFLSTTQPGPEDRSPLARQISSGRFLRLEQEAQMAKQTFQELDFV